MATPLYDALVAKVRDWSNRPEAATLPNTVFQDCLKYGADDIYRELRIPPLEMTRTYTVSSADNNTKDKYTVIPIPTDLTAFIGLRPMSDTGGRDSPYFFNTITDMRTFLDPFADQYSRFRFMWRGDEIWIHPQQKVGDKIEIHYYRRLPLLNATFTVVAANWLDGTVLASQPFLASSTTSGLFLWIVDGIHAFNTSAEADAYIAAHGGTKAQVQIEGKEAPNWLRDSNERLLIWAALKHVGAYLEDDKMLTKYESKVNGDIEKLNREEVFRRAKGGNVQINVNTQALI